MRICDNCREQTNRESLTLSQNIPGAGPGPVPVVRYGPFDYCDPCRDALIRRQWDVLLERQVMSAEVAIGT
jgi:hypothetical protein